MTDERQTKALERIAGSLEYLCFQSFDQTSVKMFSLDASELSALLKTLDGYCADFPRNNKEGK